MENGSTGSPPAAAASFPPWVILNRNCHRQDSIVPEAKTTAAATCTSTNLPFHVSLLLAAPPAKSMLHYGCCDDDATNQDAEGEEEEIINALSGVAVIAAHSGAVLVEVTSSQKRGLYGRDDTWDYFLYETSTTRPPSLLKLPGCYFPNLFQRDDESQRIMSAKDTGLLRCGGGVDDGVLLLAQLEVSFPEVHPRGRADLCILRVGQEWEHKRAVPILLGDHHPGSVMMRQWKTDRVVAVGDRYLCWVDYLLGFLFCDMAADNDVGLKLRYAMLPLVPLDDVGYCDDRNYMRYCRDLAGVGVGAGAVRFVTVESRCCCGGHGRSTCARGRFLFTVTTWTLSLSMNEPLEWVKEGVLDCTELWALPAYKGLPRVMVEVPVVSLDNPDVIWFEVAEDVQDNALTEDRREWMVEVDTRSRTLLSVVPYTDRWPTNSHVATKLRC